MKPNENVTQQILSIVDEQIDAIETLDSGMMMETVSVAMALDKLRESINLLETHLNEREFEKASHIGYQELAHNFVYVQRTLAGLLTINHQKDSLISSITQKAHAAYEDVAPYVEKKMQSAIKKSANPTKKS
ncbi:MAG: hypothetical protein ACXWUD_10425 [Methylosarcina sp.]